jgi:hypothetical protein
MRLTFDTSAIQRQLIDPLLGSPQRLRNAVATALTRTAIAVREAQRAEMRDVFDRPTPFTLGSLFVQPASGDQAVPEARVGIKDNVGGARSAWSWLRWQVLGGMRTNTAFERKLIAAGAMRDGDRMVPGRYAKRDAFGNVSRGQLVQILSQLRIDSTIGSTRSLPRLDFNDRKIDRNRKLRSIRAAYKRAGGQYLALPNGSARGKLLPGIYLVDRFNRQDILPVLIFVSKAQYEARRFDFSYVAELAIQRNLPGHLTGQLARAVLAKQAGPGVRVRVAG